MITKEKSTEVIWSSNFFEKEILRFISQDIRNVLGRIDRGMLSTIEEIRIRANKPLMVSHSHHDYFVHHNGSMTKMAGNSFVVSQNEVLKTLELMSENSVYAFQDEIKNGYITLKGGHRVGVTGRIVIDGTGIKNIKDFSGLNIRIAREVEGCSKKVVKYMIDEYKQPFNTLFISPPQCGKTTMLRDVARTISDGISELGFPGTKVGIVDERSEIAACYKGVPQNNVGLRTDVLDGCPKAAGMAILLRSMSPNVIITDEIGNAGDKDAVMQVINAGVKIITTAHGYNISELKSREEVLSLLNSKVFDRYIVLSSMEGPGTVEEILDGKTMSVLYRRG